MHIITVKELPKEIFDFYNRHEEVEEISRIHHVVNNGSPTYKVYLGELFDEPVYDEWKKDYYGDWQFQVRYT